VAELSSRIKRLKRSFHPYLPYFLHYVKKESDKILDLGCGLLSNARYLAEKGFNVASVDFNLEYLFYNQKVFPQIISVCSDLCFLPFRSDLFGGTIIVDLLEHLPMKNVNKALEETIRVMQINSYIFLHIPLEGSFAYCFLRLVRKIWMRDPTHKHSYKYGEIKKILDEFPIRIEEEWVDKRLRFFKNPNISAVAVTFILRVKGKEG